MELLRGDTLAARLRAVGRMTTAEARPIVEQMAAGLAAAHRAGVVHRDFKSANVVLIPCAPNGELRAVVTDFGLARSLEAGEAVSSAAGMMGTSAYMAPEQVAGGEATGAADIYALGVVMYEMVTGVKPFVGDSPLATAMKRLKERPASPRTHVEDLDPAWEAAILRCLERQPGNRFAGADEILKALASGAALRAAKTARRIPLVAGLAALVFLGSILAYRTFVLRGVGAAARPVQDARSTPPVLARRSVALLGFRNLSGRADRVWLSVALAEMLSTELAAGEKLRTIPGENVARMKVELSLADAESLASDTLNRIRTSLGTDVVVLGSYLVFGDGHRIRLDLRYPGDGRASRDAQQSQGRTALLGGSLASPELRCAQGARSIAEGRRAGSGFPAEPRCARGGLVHPGI